MGSSFIGHVPGNFIGMTQRADNLLVTPLFALFFFALFVPFARPLGVIVGMIYGVSTAALIAFSGSIYEVLEGASFFGISTIQTTPISFQWIGPVALIVNLAAGVVASRLLQPGRGGVLWRMVIVLIPLPFLVVTIIPWPWIDVAFL